MIYTVKLRKFIPLVLVFAVCLVLCAFYTFRSATVTTENWGLSFGESNAPPVANESAEKLKEFDAFYIGDTEKNTIYLTFDAGYENGNTAKILDTLKKHNVKAAFFVVGNYISSSPELIKRMADEGHIVANHTYHHPDMSSISDIESFKEELLTLETIYKDTCGYDMPKLYRPPQGKYNENNLKMAKDLGYKTILWSLAYVDWYENEQPDPQDAINKLTERIHPGAVVLLHSTSSTNAEILDKLLTKWKDMGYTVDTVDKL